MLEDNSARTYELLQQQYEDLQRKLESIQLSNEALAQAQAHAQVQDFTKLVQEAIRAENAKDSTVKANHRKDLAELDPSKLQHIKRLCQTGITVLRNRLKQLDVLNKQSLLDWQYAFRNFETTLKVAASSPEHYEFSPYELQELKSHGVENATEARVCLKYIIEDLNDILREKVSLEFILPQKILGMEIVDLEKVLKFISGSGEHAIEASEIIRDAFEMYDLVNLASTRFEDPVDLARFINSIRSDKMYYKQLQIAFIWLHTNLGIIQTYNMVKKTDSEIRFVSDVSSSYKEVLGNDTLMKCMTTVAESTPNSFEYILKSLESFRSKRIVTSKYRKPPYTGLLSESLKEWRRKMPPPRTNFINQSNSTHSSTSTLSVTDEPISPKTHVTKNKVPLEDSSYEMKSYIECAKCISPKRKKELKNINNNQEAVFEIFRNLPKLTLDSRIDWQPILKFLYPYLEYEKDGNLAQRTKAIDLEDVLEFNKLGINSFNEMLYFEYYMLLTIEKIIIEKVPKSMVNKDRSLKIKKFLNFVVGYEEHEIPWKTVVRDAFEMNDLITAAIDNIDDLCEACEVISEIRISPQNYIKLAIFDIWLHTNFGLMEAYNRLKNSGKELYFMDAARKVFEKDMEDAHFRMRFIAMLIYPRNSLDQIMSELENSSEMSESKSRIRPPYKSQLAQFFQKWGSVILKSISNAQGLYQANSQGTSQNSTAFQIYQPPIIITPTPNDLNYYYDTWTNPDPYFCPILSNTPVGPYPGMAYETVSTGLLPYPGGTMGAIDPLTINNTWSNSSILGATPQVVYSQDENNDPAEMGYEDVNGEENEGAFEESYGNDGEEVLGGDFIDPSDMTVDPGISSFDASSGGDFSSAADFSGCSIF